MVDPISTPEQQDESGYWVLRILCSEETVDALIQIVGEFGAEASFRAIIQQHPHWDNEMAMGAMRHIERLKEETDAARTN